jgi:cephalosporin hydroxylase
MSEYQEFKNSVSQRIKDQGDNVRLKKSADDFMLESTQPKYSYNFEWLGRPFIQYPQDMIAIQEIIWTVQPDLIIETGIAHGGSLIFSASMLALLDICSDGIVRVGGRGKGDRLVVGIDIDIRKHNKEAIEKHGLSSFIHLIEGSSTDRHVFEEVQRIASRYQKVLVLLDSNHTHEHVLQELKLFSNLVSVNSYCVVFDTIIERFGDDMYPDRSWGPGDSPLSAVNEFLSESENFEVDKFIDNKLLISVAPCGYLKRIK